MPRVRHGVPAPVYGGFTMRSATGVGFAGSPTSSTTGGSPTTRVTLSGAAGSGAVGTFVRNPSPLLNGASGAGAAGALAKGSSSLAFVGVAATGAAGSFAFSITTTTPQMDGVAAAGFAGVPTFAISTPVATGMTLPSVKAISRIGSFIEHLSSSVTPARVSAVGRIGTLTITRAVFTSWSSEFASTFGG